MAALIVTGHLSGPTYCTELWSPSSGEIYRRVGPPPTKLRKRGGGRIDNIETTYLEREESGQTGATGSENAKYSILVALINPRIRSRPTKRGCVCFRVFGLALFNRID
jgi:hypothetical protein